MKITIHDHDERLKSVYTVSSPFVAKMICNKLRDNGIECEVGGEHQAGFTGALEIDILVKATDFAAANEILEHHQSKAN